MLRLGNRTDLGSRPTNWLNSAQGLIAVSHFANEFLDVLGGVGAQLVTVSGTSVYDVTAVPTSLTNIIGIRTIRNDTTGVRMRKFPWTDFRQLNQQASGAPLRYARWGSYLAVDPQPDAVYTLKIDYRRSPVLGTIEVPDRFQETLIDIAEYYGWKSLQQFDKAQAVYSSMPATWQTIVSSPMDRNEWESMFDPDLRIAPAGFESPYLVNW